MPSQGGSIVDSDARQTSLCDLGPQGLHMGYQQLMIEWAFPLSQRVDAVHDWHPLTRIAFLMAPKATLSEGVDGNLVVDSNGIVHDVIKFHVYTDGSAGGTENYGTAGRTIIVVAEIAEGFRFLASAVAWSPRKGTTLPSVAHPQWAHTLRRHPPCYGHCLGATQNNIKHLA